MNIGVNKFLFSGIKKRRRNKKRQAFDRLCALIATNANREDGLFDADWYERTYPDIVSEGHTAIYHYLHHGHKEGRDPGPNFDTRFYLTTYPDVGASGLNPLVHYILHGRAEGRQCKKAGSHDPGQPRGVRHGTIKAMTLAPGEDTAIFVTHASAGRLKPHVQSCIEQISGTGLPVLLVAITDQPLEQLYKEVEAAGGGGGYTVAYFDK